MLLLLAFTHKKWCVCVCVCVCKCVCVCVCVCVCFGGSVEMKSIDIFSIFGRLANHSPMGIKIDIFG